MSDIPKHTPLSRLHAFNNHAIDGWGEDASCLGWQQFSEALDELYGHECQQLDCDGMCDSPQNHANIVQAVNSLPLLQEAEKALDWYKEQLHIGVLCRNTERDGESTYQSRMLEFVMGLKRADVVLSRLRAARDQQPKRSKP